MNSFIQPYPVRASITRCLLWIAALAACLVLASFPAQAQDLGNGLTLSFPEGTGLTQRALQLIALLTVLSLAPSILIMITSFTRIVVVLSLLRTAIGAQTAPPNSVITALALFLTAFIMAPTAEVAFRDGVQPLLAQPFLVFSKDRKTGPNPFHAHV